MSENKNINLIDTDIFEELEYLTIMLSGTDELTEIYAIIYYVAVRISPLIESEDRIIHLSKTTANEIGAAIIENYFKKDISIDVMIDAIFTFVDNAKTCPKISMLRNNMKDFITDVYKTYKKH